MVGWNSGESVDAADSNTATGTSRTQCAQRLRVRDGHRVGGESEAYYSLLKHPEMDFKPNRPEVPVQSSLVAINFAVTATRFTRPPLSSFPPLRPRPLQHGVQQHVAPRLNVLGLGVFYLVVADAVLARYEDHPAGRKPRSLRGRTFRGLI